MSWTEKQYYYRLAVSSNINQSNSIQNQSVVLHTSAERAANVSYLAEKLEVCSLSPAALYQTASCGFSLFLYYSLQYLNLTCCLTMQEMTMSVDAFLMSALNSVTNTLNFLRPLHQFNAVKQQQQEMFSLH